MPDLIRAASWKRDGFERRDVVGAARPGSFPGAVRACECRHAWLEGDVGRLVAAKVGEREPGQVHARRQRIPPSARPPRVPALLGPGWLGPGWLGPGVARSWVRGRRLSCSGGTASAGTGNPGCRLGRLAGQQGLLAASVNAIPWCRCPSRSARRAGSSVERDQVIAVEAGLHHLVGLGPSPVPASRVRWPRRS